MRRWPSAPTAVSTSGAGWRRCWPIARPAATASTRNACCAWPNTAATACAPCAPIPASSTSSAPRARCSCSAPPRRWKPRGATSPCSKSAACRTNCSTATACPPPSRRWRARWTSWPAACACPTTKPAIAGASPCSWPRRPRRWACNSASTSRSRGWTCAAGRWLACAWAASNWRPTATSRRSVAIRMAFCVRWAWICRSTPSRAIRSPFP
ncbi:Uncharacterised protein [Bordetella pertussis]|nr:Uncharacterised protein [Bordetella pertussis]